jgi:Lon protease-like protein
LAECNVNVTFSKLLEVVNDEIAVHQSLSPESHILLEEVLEVQESPSFEGDEKTESMGNTGTFAGGRLAATFEMSKLGLLRFSSDVIYKTLPSTIAGSEDSDDVLLARLREVALKELDCLVCYNMMLDPTTTACGHTFCRRCLTRVMDHSNICPVCRRDLHIPASLQNQSSNIRLVSLLNRLCPDLVAERQNANSKEEQVGEQALDTPLFVCTLSLPTMPTFLHVFEPRYRLMMRRCMEGNRRFGMVMYNQSSAPQGDLGATRFLEYGTLLEIVNLQLLRDGRSFIETRGIGRFRILQHGMLDGYDIARVERVEDVSLSEEEYLEQAELTAAQAQAQEYMAQNPDVQITADNFPNLRSTADLFAECIEFVEAMRQRSAPWLSARIVSVYGSCPQDDPALFPYWFASVLPIAEEEKYLLLKTTSVRERLKIVYSWINRIKGQRWPSGSACNIL